MEQFNENLDNDQQSIQNREITFSLYDSFSKAVNIHEVLLYLFLELFLLFFYVNSVNKHSIN